MACYGDIVGCLHVDNVSSSQEAHLWTSTACYEDICTCLHVVEVRSSQETPMTLHGLLTGIALLVIQGDSGGVTATDGAHF
jgi:hypothetical protein